MTRQRVIQDKPLDKNGLKARRSSLWNSKKYIGKIVSVSIDRPLGSVHPKRSDIVYKVNYGFVPDTVSGDGDELDCYVLGIDYPIKEYKGNVLLL